MRRVLPTGFLASFILFGPLAPAAAPGTHGHYLVLTGKTRTPPPFSAVDFLHGPRERVEGTEAFWWQLEVQPAAGKGESQQKPSPLFRLRALTSRDPLGESREPLRFFRYILRIDSAGETLEYRNAHTGRALLPGWRDFKVHFVPHPARGSGVQKGVPETLEFLGHVLTLQWAGTGVAWDRWEDVQVLPLDPELLVGTGRNFRDSEGHRLPQKPERRNYNYVRFTRAEYPVMIDAGINLFIVDGQQAEWVRGRPVFHIRRWGGEPPLRFPADFYRSNYLGAVMFMDEPGIIMVGDQNIHNTLRYFSDAAAVLQKRVRDHYASGGNYSAFRLDRDLRRSGVNLGDLQLEQHDYPAWETLFETAHYQLRAGLAGIVHEGRYRLAPFDEAMGKWMEEPRKHTPGELLRYHFAFLRGAARAFGKNWGTSIYGQCDPEISPLAVTLAYDMGARYIWFWTSDHDHHMPWPEQLELARTLKRHRLKRPRPSIFQKRPVIDRAIAIPYGYFVSLRYLWWVRALDREGKNEASARYGRLLRRVIAEVHEAFERGEDFDITVDEGRPIEGYRKVLRIGDGEE